MDSSQYLTKVNISQSDIFQLHAEWVILIIFLNHPPQDPHVKQKHASRHGLGLFWNNPTARPSREFDAVKLCLRGSEELSNVSLIIYTCAS